MHHHDDLRDLPLSDEVKWFIDATRRNQERERESMLRFAAVLCTCRPWYDHRNPEPAQMDCLVHTTVLMDGDGGWM